MAYTSLLTWVELNLSLLTSTPTPQQEAIQIETSASVLGMANSVFDRHACAVHLKKNNCNALPVPFAKTGSFFALKWTLKSMSKNTSKKGSKMDTKGTPNGSQNGPKLVQNGGSESGPKLGTPLGGQIVRFCCYLQYFRGVGPLGKGSLLDTFLVPFWDPKWCKKGPNRHLKNSSENRSIWDPFWVPFLEPLWEPRGQNKEHG